MACVFTANPNVSPRGASGDYVDHLINSLSWLEWHAIKSDIPLKGKKCRLILLRPTVTKVEQALGWDAHEGSRPWSKYHNRSRVRIDLESFSGDPSLIL